MTGSKSYITDQDSPSSQRWGGWYVSGPLATGSMANAIAPDGAASLKPALQALPEHSFDPAKYLAPGSDAVALLVLGHQTGPTT
ncbi:hypothetical protein H1235_13565 [Pseudoxanthomonas sp. NC8]|nr:hypothetical protein H1235_13565 [Pseudoxanthomonas sp. NC8]